MTMIPPRRAGGGGRMACVSFACLSIVNCQLSIVYCQPWLFSFCFSFLLLPLCMYLYLSISPVPGREEREEERRGRERETG